LGTGKGLYTTNGVPISVMKCSRSSRPDPDLYIFELPGFFPGYYAGFAEYIERAQLLHVSHLQGSHA